jgi:flagellar L-ring protein precursor FlgH
MRRLFPLVCAALAALYLSGCSVVPPKPLAHSAGFEPVFPAAVVATKPSTGGIYVARQSDSWFGRGRNFQVGDVITVLLNESTQAARTQNSDISRTSENDLVPAGMTNKMGTLGGLFNGTNLLGGSISNTGKGVADQQASLTGSVAVTVVDILANGNLVLRGEKQVALSEGAETIQVAGIIRPEDIAPNNTVQSRRLAHAQISYRGTGDLAAATRPGWGTSGLMKLWPF